MEEFQQCSKLIEEDVYECLSPVACVEHRQTTGAPSSKTTSVQIRNMKAFCKKSTK